MPADPATVYECWVSAERHAEMTGSAATSEATDGGTFTAWDGYITGTHRKLEPGKRIVQSWRTTEFPPAAPDSTVEIRLSKAPKGTKISVLQSDIPDGQADMYAEGWLKFYFDPMTRYFDSAKNTAPSSAKKGGGNKKAPAKKTPVKKAAARKSASKKSAKKTAVAKSAPKKKSVASKGRAKAASARKAPKKKAKGA